MENEIKGYGRIAIEALKKFNQKRIGLYESWMQAAYEIYPNSISRAEKGCPRTTFLGLCEEGYIKGVPKGIYRKQQRKNGNKEYAVNAVKALLKDPSLRHKRLELWEKAIGGKTIGENNQMDVILALLEKGYLIGFS